MKWWLSVFFLIEGEWTPGEDFQGWSPRAFDTQQECEDRRSFAERECRLRPLAYDTVWICSEGKPATAVPPDAHRVDC
jgi:hypothetical protein